MRIIFTVFLGLYLTAASAQYNDSTHFYAGLMATGTINTTTTSRAYIFSNTLKLGVRKKDLAFNATNTWLYGEQQKVITNNDYSTAVDCNLYKTLPHFYYWGLANYTTSYSLKINSQYQGGLGAAYNIIDKKDAYLNVSDGILYEGSDIYLLDTVRDVYNTFRNSFRLSFRFVIWDIITVSNVSFYQNSLSSGSDYIIRSNTGLGIKVRKCCALTTTFTYNRFNRTQKENTLINYGLSLEKYF